MRSIFVGLAVVMPLLALSTSANAGSLTLALGADDYGQLTVDGTVLGTLDAYPGGGFEVPVDLSPGWHDITIDYKNRWGSNDLALNWKLPGDSSYSLVPLADLRSLYQAGGFGSGLFGEYFDLSGNALFNASAEGPIWHGAYWFGPDLGEVYNGVPGLWAGRFGPWAAFEERLSGEIYIPDSGVPEPGTCGLVLIGVGLVMRKRLASGLTSASRSPR